MTLRCVHRTARDVCLIYIADEGQAARACLTSLVHGCDVCLKGRGRGARAGAARVWPCRSRSLGGARVVTERDLRGLGVRAGGAQAPLCSVQILLTMTCRNTAKDFKIAHPMQHMAVGTEKRGMMHDGCPACSRELTCFQTGSVAIFAVGRVCPRMQTANAVTSVKGPHCIACNTKGVAMRE